MKNVKKFAIDGMTVEINADGYINATAFCQMAGQRFFKWLGMGSSSDLVKQTASDLRVLPEQVVIAERSRKSTVYWVHPKIAGPVAEWCGNEYGLIVQEAIRLSRPTQESPAQPAKVESPAEVIIEAEPTKPTLEPVFIRQIGDNVIHQRKDGYVNATQLCKAAGKRMNDYFRNIETKDFTEHLSSVTGIPVTVLVQMKQGGIASEQGTWVHPRVAIDLARWCSPEFAVMVNGWVFELMTEGTASVRENLNQTIPQEFLTKFVSEMTIEIIKVVKKNIRQLSPKIQKTPKTNPPVVDQDESAEMFRIIRDAKMTEFTSREMMRKNSRRFKTIKIVTDAAQKLVSLGWLDEVRPRVLRRYPSLQYKVIGRFDQVTDDQLANGVPHRTASV